MSDLVGCPSCGDAFRSADLGRALNVIAELKIDRRSCHLMIGKLARLQTDELLGSQAIEMCRKQDPNTFSPLREATDE